MTSPKPLAFALCFALALLGGCAVGRPTGITARSNSYCTDALTSIGKLDRPTDPKMQMQYATDRYTAIEHAVAELTDSTLPSGSAGERLRTEWLRPARASLAAGRGRLEQLRVAVNSGDRSGADLAFADTETIGTQGVDLGLLGAQGLTSCARLFGPSST